MIPALLGRVARHWRRVRPHVAAGAEVQEGNGPDKAAPPEASFGRASTPSGDADHDGSHRPPSTAEDLRRAGAHAFQSGDGAQALSCFAQALALEPDHVPTHVNRGIVLRSIGCLADAESSLRQALALDPCATGAHANLGLVLLERGDVAGAEAELDRAIAADPGNVDAINNLGSLYRDTGRLEQACLQFRRALDMRPRHSVIWQNLGATEIARGNWEAAIASYRSATSCDERSAASWSSLGYALAKVGSHEEAEASCRRALLIAPDSPDALVNLASVLMAQGDIEAARGAAHRAIAVAPRHAGAHMILGTILRDGGNSTEAEGYFRRAIEIDPAAHGAQYNLAVLRLLHGDYLDGFSRFESRFAAFPQAFGTGIRAALVADHARRWHGEPLRRRHLLLWSEQGLGDAIMMLRFLPLLSRFESRRVTLLCDPRVARLAQAVGGVDQIIAGDLDALPDFDVHCPLMSLPHVFRITRDSIPGAEGYLRVPEEQAAYFAGRLPPASLRVGLAWAGNPALQDDLKRSVPLAAFAPLFALPSVSWISLQKGDAGIQREDERANLFDPMAQCNDFLDTSGVIANLDLVISVDTAVAHLAAGMGVPTWVLNRAGSEWRWGSEGERTPWYSAISLFRQEHHFEWSPTIEAVARRLQQHESSMAGRAPASAVRGRATMFTGRRG